jgi:DNA polymerase III delta prime subunit
MSATITVRVKNILGTEETDIQIASNATVGQLLEEAAPRLQINPQGATIMYQGQQLPPGQPLDKAGVRDQDAVMVAPGSVVGGGGGPLLEITSQVITPIVVSIIANFIYDRLRGTDLKELTKRLIIGIFSQNRQLIPRRKIQYEVISEKVAEYMHRELTAWGRINEEHGVEILERLLSKKSMNAQELKNIIENDSELAETICRIITSGKAQVKIELKEDILRDTENLLREVLQ